MKTAQVSVVVPKGTFGDSFAKASEIATNYGGYVATSSTQGSKSGQLLIRVPADTFDLALADLRKLGRVEGESISGRDVTGQFIDFQARLRIAEARRKVLLGLMAKATSIEQTIRVQNALDDAQLNIEEIEGQLRVLNNQTAKATIRVNLREAGVPINKPQESVTNPSLGSAWRHAIAGFFGVLFAVVVGLGYLVPVGLLAVVLWLVARRVRRRVAA